MTSARARGGRVVDEKNIQDLLTVHKKTVYLLEECLSLKMRAQIRWMASLMILGVSVCIGDGDRY